MASKAMGCACAAGLTIIRTAKSDDIASIAILVEKYWRVAGIDGYDRIRAERQLNRVLAGQFLGEAWLAECDGKACGYLLIAKRFCLEYGGMVAEIDELYVAPENRNSSIGSALVRNAERSAIAQGCVRMRLNVSNDNAIARGFFHHAQFEECTDFRLFDKPLTYPADA